MNIVPLVRVKKLHEDAEAPVYAKPGDAGADLKSIENLVIPPDTTCMVKTGIAIELAGGYEAQIRSRSGLALKKSVFVLNSPGTVDEGYRGEVCVILRNEGSEDFVVNKGDRIAQMVIKPVVQAKFDVVPYLTATLRGEDGFGSSGVS